MSILIGAHLYVVLMLSALMSTCVPACGQATFPGCVSAMSDLATESSIRHRGWSGQAQHWYPAEDSQLRSSQHGHDHICHPLWLARTTRQCAEDLRSMDMDGAPDVNKVQGLLP